MISLQAFLFNACCRKTNGNNFLLKLSENIASARSKFWFLNFSLKNFLASKSSLFPPTKYSKKLSQIFFWNKSSWNLINISQRKWNFAFWKVYWANWWCLFEERKIFDGETGVTWKFILFFHLFWVRLGVIWGWPVWILWKMPKKMVLGALNILPKTHFTIQDRQVAFQKKNWVNYIKIFFEFLFLACLIF